MSGDDVVRGDAVHSVFSVMVGALDAINRLGSCSVRRGTMSPYETRYGVVDGSHTSNSDYYRVSNDDDEKSR